MSGEILLALCGAMLAIALAVAVYCDLKWRIIPDRLNIAIIAGAPLAWYAQGLSPSSELPIQLAAAGALFGFFLLQFNFNIIGGGDVKLLGAVGLWVAPSLMLSFVMGVALVGAGISVAMLINLKRQGKPAFSDGINLRLPDDKDENVNEINTERFSPYGLAIAVAGWWVIHQQYFNHFLGMSPN
jgi:prepilin peptidase CpaA